MASASERKVRDKVGKEDKDRFTQSPVGLVQILVFVLRAMCGH